MSSYNEGYNDAIKELSDYVDVLLEKYKGRTDEKTLVSIINHIILYLNTVQADEEEEAYEMEDGILDDVLGKLFDLPNVAKIYVIKGGKQ